MASYIYVFWCTDDREELIFFGQKNMHSLSSTDGRCVNGMIDP
jgi:hypothetical protein